MMWKTSSAQQRLKPRDGLGYPGEGYFFPVDEGQSTNTVEIPWAVGQLQIVVPHAVDVAKRAVIRVDCDWSSSKIHSEGANSSHQRQGFFLHCQIVKFRLTKLPTQIYSILDVPSHRLSEK